MLYFFNKEEELINVFPSKSVKSAIQTQELKKTISLDAEIIGVTGEDIKEAEFIGHFYKDIFYLYKILRARTKETTTIIKGIHIVFDELKSNGYIRDKRLTDTTAAIALNTALDGTRWEVGIVNYNPVASAFWYDKTHLEALTDIVNKWGCELRYRILFDGKKIYKRYIDIYKELGKDLGKRIVYGSNAAEVTAETTKSGVYTAIIGRGKGEQKTDENGEATGGYGRRINFKEIEWRKDKGDPLDKPLGQEFIEDPEATKLFGFGDKPRTTIEIFQDCTEPEKLLYLSYKRLMQINRPLVTFKTKVQKLGATDLGDTLRIIRRDLDLFYKARVFKMEVNLLDDSFTKIFLGDYIASNAEKQRIEGKHQIAEANAKIEEVQEEIGTKVSELLTDLKEGIELSYWNDTAFNYELANDNKWGLPAGYYSFNAQIDNNPTKVIFFGAGKLMIANKKISDGSWDWSTFGTGDGFTADLITAGTIKGNFIEAGSIKGDRLAANSITGDKIRANSITGAEIKANSITGDKIKAGEIEADKISTRTIKAENIDFGEIGYDEIGRHAVEGENVARKTLNGEHIKEITVDILRPGAQNRIIFDGDDPGNNNAKSIDATGEAVRLKRDSSNYVYVDRKGIEFYTRTGETWTRGGNFYADNYENKSDVRAKENIGYIGHTRRIKPNENVEVIDLTPEEITAFLKDIKIATYNYQFADRMQIGAIAQNLEKVDKIGKYLVREEDKRKYINVNNLLSMDLVATRELIKKVEELERRLNNDNTK